MATSRTGKLDHKVFFYKYVPRKGPEPGEEEKEILFRTRAEIYDPSIKDRTMLNSTEATKALTIVFRDPRGKYVPDNKDFVEIFDYRYAGVRWNIIDVRPDMTNNRFVTVLLEAKSEVAANE